MWNGYNGILSFYLSAKVIRITFAFHQCSNFLKTKQWQQYSLILISILKC